MTPKFPCKIENGKLTLDNRDEFWEYVKGQKGEYELILKKKSKKITNPELRYYYGVIIKTLSKELGYTTDEMDIILKYKFCRKFDERGLLILPSKTEFSTTYTEAFFEEVRIWALTDLNIKILLPNQIEE